MNAKKLDSIHTELKSQWKFLESINFQGIRSLSTTSTANVFLSTLQIIVFAKIKR